MQLETLFGSDVDVCTITLHLGDISEEPAEDTPEDGLLFVTGRFDLEVVEGL
jgi:hypothetical protein